MALVRAPQWRDQTECLLRQQQAMAQQQALFTRQLLAFDGQLAVLARRMTAWDDAAPDGQDNLLRSVPVALRNVGFDVHQLRQQARDTAATLAGVAATVDSLRERVEWVRRELMYEMRYGAGAGEEVAAARPAGTHATTWRQGVKLNLGCGHFPRDGYLNVDRRPLPGVDLVAEVDALPFAPGQVQEISSAHLLEHFPQEQLRRQLLPYFHALLEDGGRLHAVVPDAEAMLARYADGSYPFSHLREVLYGAQDYDGDFHFNLFTPASLTALLEEAGFVDVALLHAGRKNGHCYEFEISARKATLP